MNGHSSYRKIIDKLMSSINYSDFVIFLLVDREVVSERIAIRCDNGSRFEGDNIDNISSRLAGTDAIFEYFSKYLLTNKVDFLSLNATDTVNSLAVSICKHIAEMVRLENHSQL
jgi:deoxyadenosine/deoxycytidine kinase